MKENFKLGGILLVITLIAGVLLGISNQLTREKIIENSKINKDDLAYIMPQSDSIRDVEVEVDEEEKFGVKEIYEAMSKDEVIGHVIKVSTKGFHGVIDFVIGISNENYITGIKVLAHNETPGLGARITETTFTEKFRDKPIAEFLKIVKTAPLNDYEVEGISGATVSSKATASAINDGIRFYREKINGEVVAPEEETDADSAASE